MGESAFVSGNDTFDVAPEGTIVPSIIAHALAIIAIHLLSAPWPRTIVIVCSVLCHTQLQNRELKSRENLYKKPCRDKE